MPSAGKISPEEEKEGKDLKKFDFDEKTDHNQLYYNIDKA